MQYATAWFVMWEGASGVFVSPDTGQSGSITEAIGVAGMRQPTEAFIMLFRIAASAFARVRPRL
jgi:hypothetical protein